MTNSALAEELMQKEVTISQLKLVISSLEQQSKHDVRSVATETTERTEITDTTGAQNQLTALGESSDLRINNMEIALSSSVDSQPVDFVGKNSGDASDILLYKPGKSSFNLSRLMKHKYVLSTITTLGSYVLYLWIQQYTENESGEKSQKTSDSINAVISSQNHHGPFHLKRLWQWILPLFNFKKLK